MFMLCYVIIIKKKKKLRREIFHFYLHTNDGVNIKQQEEHECNVW